MTGESEMPRESDDTGTATEASAAAPEYETGGLRLVILLGLVAYVGIAHGWSWVVLLVGLVAMIFLHELGHFMTARWTGMKATEFFIGFGPKVWSFRRGETEYGIKAIPAGAYVRIIGMTTAEEVAPEDEGRTYRQQTFPRRLLVVSAGSLMHVAQAFVIAVALLVFVGTPGGALMSEPQVTEEQEANWYIGSVLRGGGAEAAGLMRGDRIVAWDGEPIQGFNDVGDAVRGASVGDEFLLTVERDGERFDQPITLVDGCSVNVGGDGDEFRPAPPGPFLGIQSELPDRTLGVVEGTTEAVAETGRALWGAGGALRDFLSPSTLADFLSRPFNGGSDGQPDGPAASNPCAFHGDGDDEAVVASSSSSGTEDDGRVMSLLGAMRIGNSLSDSLAGLLVFFFILNVFIGLFNMLPLLPLDGGHAVVAIYERVRSRKGKRYHADANKLMPMAYAGLTLLLVIGLTAFYLDLIDPVRL